MESPAKPSLVKVRYGLRGTLSPLLLALCLGELTGSIPAACIIFVLGILLSALILLRPYMVVRNGGAFHVCLVTGRKWPIPNLDAVLSLKCLHWFVRKSDLEKVRHLCSSGELRRRMTSAGDGGALSA